MTLRYAMTFVLALALVACDDDGGGGGSGKDGGGAGGMGGGGGMDVVGEAPGAFEVAALAPEVTLDDGAPLELTRLTIATQPDDNWIMLSGRIRNTGAARLCFVKVDDGVLTLAGGGTETWSTFVDGVHRVLEGTGATTNTCVEPGAEAPFWESTELPEGETVASVTLTLAGSETPTRDPVSRVELDGMITPTDDGERTSFSGTLRNVGAERRGTTHFPDLGDQACRRTRRRS